MIDAALDFVEDCLIELLLAFTFQWPYSAKALGR